MQDKIEAFEAVLRNAENIIMERTDWKTKNIFSIYNQNKVTIQCNFCSRPWQLTLKDGFGIYLSVCLKTTARWPNKH